MSWDYSSCDICRCIVGFVFFKQKTAYEMRISDWSSDVCSSDLIASTNSTVSAQVDIDQLPRGIAVDQYRPGGIGLQRQPDGVRSEERRVREECVSTCRSGWSTTH